MKTLAMRGLCLWDSIQLVTWLHGLPITRAKDFLNHVRDSPRMTVIHILEGCEQIALLTLATQGNLSGRQKHSPSGDPTGTKLLPFFLVFDHELFPRLTYVTELKASTYWTPERISEDQLRNLPFLYHTLPDNEIQKYPIKLLPQRTPANNHLRPIVETGRGTIVNQARQTLREQPGQDLGHNDLLVLFEYDEKMGLSLLTLDKGTEIEIPVKDVHGMIFWIAGQVTSVQTNSLMFKVQFPGCLSRREIGAGRGAELTWRSPGASLMPGENSHQDTWHSRHRDSHRGITPSTAHTGSDSKHEERGVIKMIMMRTTRITSTAGSKPWLRQWKGALSQGSGSSP